MKTNDHPLEGRSWPPNTIVTSAFVVPAQGVPPAYCRVLAAP